MPIKIILNDQSRTIREKDQNNGLEFKYKREKHSGLTTINLI